MYCYTRYKITKKYRNKAQRHVVPPAYLPPYGTTSDDDGTAERSPIHPASGNFLDMLESTAPDPTKFEGPLSSPKHCRYICMIAARDSTTKAPWCPPLLMVPPNLRETLLTLSLHVLSIFCSSKLRGYNCECSVINNIIYSYTWLHSPSTSIYQSWYMNAVILYHV